MTPEYVHTIHTLMHILIWLIIILFMVPGVWGTMWFCRKVDSKLEGPVCMIGFYMNNAIILMGGNIRIVYFDNLPMVSLLAILYMSVGAITYVIVAWVYGVRLMKRYICPRLSIYINK